MYASSVIARGKAALQGTEIEQRLAVLLYDDAVQVISSFELNQLASLTYHDSNSAGVLTTQPDLTDVLIDHFEQIQSQPINYSTMSVQKSLVVTKHILLIGAEKVVPRIKQQLGRHMEALCQYNTVLLAQQQQTGAWLMRLKGGGVDKGGPVREIANVLHNLLLLSPAQLQFERSTAADPNSLVPVGHKQQVAFCTDEARWRYLQRRMQEQQSVQRRSNLAKASDGFGSGYMAANGKTVVGAAHGIEEMLRQQKKEEDRFTDDQTAAHNAAKKATSSAVTSFSEYKAPNLYEYDYATTPKTTTTATTTQQQQQQQQHSALFEEEPDLLAMDNNNNNSTSGGSNSTLVAMDFAAAHQTADLLDFGTPTTNSNSSTSIMHTQQQQPDLLFGSLSSVPIHAAAPTSSSFPSVDIYAPNTTTPHDPFQVVSTNITPSLLLSSSSNAISNLWSTASVGSSAVTMNNTVSGSTSSVSSASTPSVMSSYDNRFAALDALTANHGAVKTTAAPTTAFAGLGLTSYHPAAASPVSAAAAASSFNALTDLSALTRANITTTTTSVTMLPQQQQQQQHFQHYPPPALAMPVSLSSIKVSQAYLGSDSERSGGSSNGFVMGGTQGTGLEPSSSSSPGYNHAAFVAAAPAAAPPPPPPPGAFF